MKVNNFQKYSTVQSIVNKRISFHHFLLILKTIVIYLWEMAFWKD